MDRGIVCVSYDGTEYSVNIYNGDSQFLFSNSNQINILYVNNNSIFYKISEDDALYCFDIVNMSNRTVTEKFTNSIGEENSNVCDFDLYHGFYFDTVESANNDVKYLHMVNLYGFGYENEDGNNIGHYIGVLDATKMK